MLAQKPGGGGGGGGGVGAQSLRVLQSLVLTALSTQAFCVGLRAPHQLVQVPNWVGEKRPH